MYRKRVLHRLHAKRRAARYGGRKNKRMRSKRHKKICALVLLAAGTGILYGKSLPLLQIPKKSYKAMERLVESENKSAREKAELPVQYISGEGSYLVINHVDGAVPEYIPPEETEQAVEAICVRNVLEERFGSLEQISFQNFLSNYYIEDASTKATEELFNVEKLLNYDLTIEKKETPQILIFHTHGSEGYADSRPGATEDTVIGVGEVLAKELRETYGYQVIHETTVFDRKADGSDDRNNAYNNALPVVTGILEKYPDIAVVIDLHRDSGEARTSVVNGVSTAKIMLFNGLCRTKDGPITYYSNEHLQGNLAFSLHLQVTGNELYPGLMHRIYLKSYRYNMHLLEKYILVELGTHKNTVAEARAAMKPFAKTLATVLSGGT